MPTAQTYQSEFTGQQMDDRLAAVASLAEALTAVQEAIEAKYTKPAGGIPATDLDADVNAALAKANSAVQSLADYYTKSEVDQLLAAINGMDYVDVAALPTASASTMGKIYLVGPDGSGYYAYYYTSYDGSAYSWVGPLGTTQISLANYATKAELNQLDQDVDSIVRLEHGSISTSTGENTTAATNCRTQFITSPFSIVLHSGYQITYTMRYTKGVDGYTFAGYKSATKTSLNVLDNIYAYRLVIKKSAGGNISDADMAEAVDTFVGKVDKTFDAVQTDVLALQEFSDGFENFETVLSGNNFDWQQGGILNAGAEPQDELDDYFLNRVKSGYYFQLASGKTSIYCSINEGFGYRVQIYNGSKVWQSQQTKDNGAAATINVTSGYYVRFVLLKSGGGNITPAEAKTAGFTVTNLDATHAKKVFSRPLGGSDFAPFSRVMLPKFDFEQGTINANGTEADSSTRIRTATYFPGGGQVITLFAESGFAYRIFYYDSNKDYVDWNGDDLTGENTYTLTSGYYYRFVLLKTSGSSIAPTEYTGFYVDNLVLDDTTGYMGYQRPMYKSNSNRNNLAGKTVAFIGDSITAGANATTEADRFYNVFSLKYGCTPRALGANGSTIASHPKNNTHDDRFVTRATAQNLGDVSLVVVFGGTNDLSYDSKAIGPLFVEETITPSGNIGDKQLAAPTDTDTFAGGLHDLIQTIQENVTPGTPVVFITPLHRDNNQNTNPNSTQCNSNGDFMVDFVDAMKKICAFYAIPVLDLYSCSQLNPLSPDWSAVFSDGLHPGNRGHKIIGEMLYRFVEDTVVI